MTIFTHVRKEEALKLLKKGFIQDKPTFVAKSEGVGGDSGIIKIGPCVNIDRVFISLDGAGDEFAKIVGGIEIISVHPKLVGKTRDLRFSMVTKEIRSPFVKLMGDYLLIERFIYTLILVYILILV